MRTRHQEYGECSFCDHGEWAEDAQTLADEIAYHEERCDENPENDGQEVK